jgi:basic amino acid/polyamine antiporter, APA family
MAQKAGGAGQSMVEGEAARDTLPRVLGFWSVVGILVGTVIGSGIFVVPAEISALLRAPLLVLLVWVMGGALSFLGALCMAELGAAFPQAGGMYVYLREAYGPLVAFLFGWTLFFVIDSGAIATLSMAFSSKYLPYFVPLSPAATKAVAVALVAGLVCVNYVGVRYGALLQNALMFVKFGAILGVTLIVFLLADGTAAHFTQPAAGPMSIGLLSAVGFALVRTLWAYKGWEATTFSAGELRNPTRDLPLGLLAGTLVVIALYLGANLAYLYVFSIAEIAQKSRVAADAVRLVVGPAGGAIVAIVILCSITGAANGNVLTAPRVFFAMAQDGLFFKRLAHVHPRYLTPHVSIVATGAWAAVLSLSGTFEQLASYVIFGQLIFFALSAAAVIVLRRARPDLRRPYRTLGYPVTPVLFILGAVLLSANLLAIQPVNALAGLGIILLGVPAYLYWHRDRPA